MFRNFIENFNYNLAKDCLIILVVYKTLKFVYHFFYFPSYFLNKLNSLFSVPIEKHLSSNFPFEGTSYVFSFISTPLVLLGVCVVTGLMYLLRRYDVMVFEPLLSWQRIKIENKYIYYLIHIVSACILWIILSFDYNFFHDSAFILDRFIFIGLFLLALRVPIFLILFTFLSLVAVAQVHVPGIYEYGMTDGLIFWEILILFSSFLVVACFRTLKTTTYLVLLLALHMSGYFYAGISKLAISPHIVEYLLSDFGVMFTQAIFYGNSFVERFYPILDFLTPFMPLLIVVLEVSAITLLLNRRISYTLLCLFSAMHILIFLVCRMIFWKWILVNMCLIYVLYKLNKESCSILYKRSTKVMFMMLVLTAPFTFNPIWLGWYQTNITNVKTIYVEDTLGKSYELNNRDFGVHSIFTTFFIQRLGYLLENGQAPLYLEDFNEYKRVMGMSFEAYKTMRHNLSIGHEGDLVRPIKLNAIVEIPLKEALEKRLILENFFKLYFKNRNNYQGLERFFPVKAIGHVYQDYTGLRGKETTPLSDIEYVSNVKIRYREFFMAGKEPLLVTDEIVLNINIDK